MTEAIQTTIQYVNPRNGNRPPTIKDGGGNYYTISDAALPFVQQFKGQTGSLGYFVNQKGYFVATHWNGQELPRGQGARPMPQGNGAPPQQPAPRPQARPAPQPAPQADVPPILSNVLAHAIQAGRVESPEQLSEWAKWTKEAIKTFNNPSAPPAAPDYPPVPEGAPFHDDPSDFPEGYGG